MRKHIVILLIFFFLFIIITLPFIFGIATYILGFFSTDEPLSLLWDSWRIKFSVFNHLSLKQTSLISYPFNVDLYSSGYYSYGWMSWHHILSILTSPVVTFNTQIVVNFFFIFLCSYMLVFFLTKNVLSSFLSGMIFSFCPYQFIRSWQHLGLTYNQWIPLCLFTAILLKENSAKKYCVYFALSLFLLYSFDHVIMYMTSISLLAYFIYLLLYNWNKKISDKNLLFPDIKYLKKVIISGFFVFLLLTPQFLPLLKNLFKKNSIASAYNLYNRPFEDLFIQSAKPLSYLLPAAVHPVFGKFTENFVGTVLYGASFTEHTLYLGWTSLILAFVAVRKWKKNRRESSSHQITKSPEQEKEHFYIGFFIFLAVAAWLFSQPPWWKIGPLKIYMPSFFMYKILPMFRAYCRFGIVVMLAVAVLAGFGLKFILEKFKNGKTKIAIAAFFCGLVLFEFWNWPPFKVIDVSKVPAVYYWLKEKKEDLAIAEYPLDASSPNEMYKFYQIKHEKKIINGTSPGTYANKVAQSMTKLSDLNTARILKWMGVKYVLVHRDDYLKTDFIEDKEELTKIPKNSGLKLIASFPSQECPDKDIMCVQKTGPIDVYEINAKSMEPKL